MPSTFDVTPVDEDDTAVILYTSGTTGQPKGLELRHRNMRANALAGSSMFGADPESPDTYLTVLPLFHSFGQTLVQNGALHFGSTIVMLPRFDPRTVSTSCAITESPSSPGPRRCTGACSVSSRTAKTPQRDVQPSRGGLRGLCPSW